MKFNAAINSGGGGKSRKLRTACACNVWCIHATRVPIYDAFTSDTELPRLQRRYPGSYIVLVLIYATHRPFLLPRYRDLSAANYTFTPVAAEEHQTDPREDPSRLPSWTEKRTRLTFSLFLPRSRLVASFLRKLSRSILSRWIKNKRSLTSA